MRKLVLVLLCSVVSAQEVRRPTTDADAFGLCSGTHIVSGPLKKAYDAAGQSTFDGLTAGAIISCGQFTCTSQTAYTQRLFSNWQTPQTTYSALTLNINSKSAGYLISGTGQTGAACLYYRTSKTGAWTSVRCDSGNGWLQQTDTITLSAAQDLSQLQVAMCVQGNTQDGTQAPPPPAPGSDNMQIYDIWTLATGTPQSGGSGSSSGKRHKPVIIN